MLASEPLSTRGENLLRELRRTQNSLQHLVRSVLEVSRLEAGTVSPNFQPVPVRPLLNGLAAEFAPQALARNLRLKIVAQDVTVTSDPILLERVLRNLVGNALRYTETGGVLIGARQRGERVWLQVIDSGVGMAAGDQDRIWQEFVQVGPMPHDRSEGMGLGLAIVDRLCRLLNHRVAVSSRIGHGSCFTVDCPRA